MAKQGEIVSALLADAFGARLMASNSGLLLVGFMVCGKLFNFFELQFPHPKKPRVDDYACFIGML